MRKALLVLSVLSVLTLPAVAEDAKYYAAKPKSKTPVPTYTNADLANAKADKAPLE